MDTQKRYYLVCYDIHDPARLRRVAKHLQGYGHRLQESVFRCRLAERQLNRLKWELQKIIDESDELLYVRLCDTCVRHVTTQGTSRHEWPVEPPMHTIV